MSECKRSFVARGLLLALLLIVTQHLLNLSVRRIGASSSRSKPNAGRKRTAKTNTVKAADVSNKLEHTFFPGASKYAEQMKHAEKEYEELYNGNHTITLKDLSDLSFEDSDEIETRLGFLNETWDEAAASRRPIMDLLDAAGLQVDLDVLRRLPRWSEVTDLYGTEPVIYGTETCEPFRNKIPTSERFVGVAGQMNTGTNALGKYLLHNLKIPENEISNGVLWTVPWYKHGWASLKQRYDYRPPENHTKVFAVVIIKDPMFWMKSMCESPYTLQWNHTSGHCPTLVDSTNTSVPVTIQWTKGYIRSWPSLAHLWSMWYREYYESSMPRIIVRYEDLLFHTEKVIDSIRDCVGASWKSETFQWQAAPAKTHPYFAKFKVPSSLVSAIIKYGTSKGRLGNMNQDDHMFAREMIDSGMVRTFNYRDP